MAANGGENGDRKRLRLLVPLSTVVTAVWLAAGVRAAVFGDVQAFAIASAPFSILCGYVFGITLPRRP